MKKKLPKLLVLVLALMLVTGLVASVSAATTAGSGQGLAGQGLRFGQKQAQTVLNAVSDLTGLSITDIRTQRADGKSLAAIAADEGVAEQTVINKVVAERTAALDQLKADNKITEDQYESCITNMTENIETSLQRTTTGNINGNQGQGLNARQNSGQGAGQGMRNGAGPNQENCANYPNCPNCSANVSQ